MLIAVRKGCRVILG